MRFLESDNTVVYRGDEDPETGMTNYYLILPNEVTYDPSLVCGVSENKDGSIGRIMFGEIKGVDTSTCIWELQS